MYTGLPRTLSLLHLSAPNSFDATLRRFGSLCRITRSPIDFCGVGSGSGPKSVGSLSLCNLQEPRVDFPKKMLEKKSHLRTETKLYSAQNETDGWSTQKGEEQNRQGVVKKVYCTVLAQVLLTMVAFLAASKYSQITMFVEANPRVFYAALIPAVLSFTSLFMDSKTNSLNLTLLGLLTITMCVSIGVYLTNINGKIVIQSLVLTSALVSSLTGYTFWASKMNKNLSYLLPFLRATLVFIIAAGSIQIFYPMGSLPNAIYNGIAGILFSAWVTHDTHRLLHGFAHDGFPDDEYVEASLRLFVDIFLLFFDVLGVVHFLVKL